MSEREWKPGDRYRVTRIVQPDWDHYAVVYMGRYAFGCSREWFEKNTPQVGGWIVMDTDGHRRFEPETYK